MSFLAKESAASQHKIWVWSPDPLPWHGPSPKSPRTKCGNDSLPVAHYLQHVRAASTAWSPHPDSLYIATYEGHIIYTVLYFVFLLPHAFPLYLQHSSLTLLLHSTYFHHTACVICVSYLSTISMLPASYLLIIYILPIAIHRYCTPHIAPMYYLYHVRILPTHLGHHKTAQTLYIHARARKHCIDSAWAAIA